MGEQPAARPAGRSRGPGRPTGPATGRDRLLNAALALFPRSGFSATTVEDLVTTAGVTPPVLYHHFGTKAGLYVAAAEETYRTVLDRHRMILDGDPSFAEAIDRLMDLAKVLRIEQPALAAMMLTVVIDVQRDPDLEEQLGPLLREFRRFFDEVAALAPPELRPTPAAQRNLARALVTLMNGLDITALMSRTLSDYRQTVSALQSLLRHGVGPG